MDLRIYLSFDDFKNNYNKDFDIWGNNYPDAKELDYLLELESLYLVALDNVTFDKLAMDIYDMPAITRAEHYGDRIIDEVLGKIKNVDGYDFKIAKKIRFSFNAILEHLIKEIGKRKLQAMQPLQTLEILDDNIDSPEKIKLKGEMIILKEFGIIDNFTKIQNLTNAECAKRIRIILSDKIEKSELKNPQKYIENILTAIGNGTPDIITDKTPYKKQNIKYALTELTKNGLSVEDTIYLKDLKQTNSNLFD